MPRGAVLIVDDWPDQRRLIQRILAPLGVETLTAADGEEALALLRQHPVALVVSDREMPRLGGEQLVAQMRLDPDLADIPVIIVTGSPDWPADAADPDVLLPKPCDANVLRGHVKRFLA